MKKILTALAISVFISNILIIFNAGGNLNFSTEIQIQERGEDECYLIPVNYKFSAYYFSVLNQIRERDILAKNDFGRIFKPIEFNLLFNPALAFNYVFLKYNIAGYYILKTICGFIFLLLVFLVVDVKNKYKVFAILAALSDFIFFGFTPLSLFTVMTYDLSKIYALTVFTAVIIFLKLYDATGVKNHFNAAASLSFIGAMESYESALLFCFLFLYRFFKNNEKENLKAFFLNLLVFIYFFYLIFIADYSIGFYSLNATLLFLIFCLFIIFIEKASRIKLNFYLMISCLLIFQFLLFKKTIPPSLFLIAFAAPLFNAEKMKKTAAALFILSASLFFICGGKNIVSLKSDEAFIYFNINRTGRYMPGIILFDEDLILKTAAFSNKDIINPYFNASKKYNEAMAVLNNYDSGQIEEYLRAENIRFLIINKRKIDFKIKEMLLKMAETDGIILSFESDNFIVKTVPLK